MACAALVASPAAGMAQQVVPSGVAVPYSATLAIDVDVALPAGGVRHTQRTMLIARDQRGRLLYTEPAADGGTAGAAQRTIIIDAANRSRTTLDAASHHALIEHILLGLLAPEPPLGLPDLQIPAGVSVTTSTGATEDLGTKTLDGVLALGTLNTSHILYRGGTGPAEFDRTTEVWRSVAGGILLEEVVHDPRGLDARVDVEGLSLAPPPPALFQLPTGYSVTERGETRELRDQLLTEARNSAASLTGLARAQAFLVVADAERLLISLPDQISFSLTPDQRKLSNMAGADAMAAFRAAASAAVAGASPPLLMSSGVTRRDEIEAQAIMIAGWEVADDQRSQALAEIVAGAGRADAPRAGIYDTILQYWYTNPPPGAPGPDQLIRQCIRADGSYPYLGLVAALRSRARTTIAADERAALVLAAYRAAAKESIHSSSFGWAAMAMEQLHGLAPKLDPQLADAIVAMLDQPDALRSLRNQGEAQLLTLLRSFAPDRAASLQGAAVSPPPRRGSPAAPPHPREQAVRMLEDWRQLNDLTTQAEATTASDPGRAAQMARTAESQLLADFEGIASAREPEMIGPAPALVEELQRLGLYDDAAALESKAFAAIGADASLVELTPSGLPYQPGSGNTFDDILLDMVGRLARLDTRSAASGAELMPDWFKPLVLAQIARQAGMM